MEEFTHEVGQLLNWCLKSINSGLGRTIVPYLQNIDFLTPRIETKKECMPAPKTLWGRYLGCSVEQIAHLFGHKVHLSLI